MKYHLKSIQHILQLTKKRLAGGSETASLDAQLLLGFTLNKSRTWLFAHPEARLDEAEIRQFESLVERRLSGEPLPYILGKWDFYGRQFVVSPAVLIPRPETEMMVETALKWINQRQHRPTVLDVGTGSGCIAISIGLNAPRTRVIGLDVSAEALRIAKINMDRLAAVNVSFKQSDLLSGLPDQIYPVDAVFANLPYIPTGTWEGLKVSRFEPRLALDGGEDGLSLIRALLDQSIGKIQKNGLIMLEIEASQGLAAERLAEARYPQANVTRVKDLAGLDRFIRIDM